MSEEEISMPDPNHPITRRSGEHNMIREMVVKAVEDALAGQSGAPSCPPNCNYKDDLNELRKDIKETVKEMREDLRGEIRTVRTDVAGDMQSMRADLSTIRGDLEDGTLEFRQLNTRLELVERKQERGSSSGLNPSLRRGEAPTTIMPALKAAPAEDPEDRPLISPRLWNALILGAVGTIGAAIGVWVAVRVGLPSGDDKSAPVPAPAPVVPPKIAASPP